jgi:hypothetical protein
LRIGDPLQGALDVHQEEAVRHRYNNRLCINPDHLEIGSRGENLQDERDFSANGVDFSLL